jgi:hypothetical protein
MRYTPKSDGDCLQHNLGALKLLHDYTRDNKGSSGFNNEHIGERECSQHHRRPHLVKPALLGDPSAAKRNDRRERTEELAEAMGMFTDVRDATARLPHRKTPISQSAPPRMMRGLLDSH